MRSECDRGRKPNQLNLEAIVRTRALMSKIGRPWNFEQRRDRLTHVLNDHSGYCVVNRLSRVKHRSKMACWEATTVLQLQMMVAVAQ